MTTQSIEKQDSTIAAISNKKNKSWSKLSAVTIRLLPCIATGLIVLFYGHKIRAIQDFDIACIRAAAASQGQIYNIDTESNTVTSRALITQPENAQKFKIIAITDDPDQVYESTPPSPLDYAVILHTLRERGAENIVLTTQMSWDGDLGITATALSGKLSDYKYAAIPLSLTRGVTAEKVPSPLRQSIIPFTNITGNQTLIPIVNQVSLPCLISDSGKTRAGFSKIENLTEDHDTIPMICIWQDEGIIPSIELLTLMTLYKVSPDEVSIHCGKHIRLGPDGPIIGIGKFGQIALPSDTANINSIPTTKAEDLITLAKPENKNTAPDPHIYMIHGIGEKTKTTNTLPPERLAAIIHWAKTLPVPKIEKPTQHRRLPIYATILIILDIALLGWWFTRLSPSNRHLAFALATAATLPFLFFMMETIHYWFSISALLATIAAAWMTPVKRRKRTTNIKKYRDTRPKTAVSP